MFVCLICFDGYVSQGRNEIQLCGFPLSPCASSWTRGPIRFDKKVPAPVLPDMIFTLAKARILCRNDLVFLIRLFDDQRRDHDCVSWVTHM